ncbi:MAG: hypothetical protein IPN52_03880 [Micrococcales bacterium]|nr:hypothetical protein [Micrococcales bacterium]
MDVTVDVVISADALIGDNDWTPESKRLGPIGSQIARDLCTSPDARWRRLVTDPVTGQLAAMATIKYRIPDHIRHAVKARDLTCRFPAATPAPNTSTATTSSPTPPAPPARTTSPGCADATTAPKPSPPGKPDATPTPHPRPHLDQPLGRTHRTTAHRYKQDE